MCDFEHPGRSCLGEFEENGWTLLMSRRLTRKEWTAANIDGTFNYLTQNYDPYIAILHIKKIAPDVEFELKWAA